MNLKIADIKLDPSIQPRTDLLQVTIDEYEEAIREGVEFPPVVVFFDGETHWLADGFHRVNAATQAGLEEVSADVQQGTRRDAILYAVGANASHGLRRTNADKRRAATMLIHDEEWEKWSDSEIGRRCAVSHTLVSNLRSSLAIDASETGNSAARTYRTKHGTVATMKIAKIGSSKARKAKKKTPAAEDKRDQQESGDQERIPGELVVNYKKDANGSALLCAICEGVSVECSTGFMLCRTDDGAPVCRECGKRHGSELQGLLDLALTNVPYWGGCPECGKNNGHTNIGQDCWFRCDQHRVKWLEGHNLFADWQDETETDWERNTKLLAEYREVKASYGFRVFSIRRDMKKRDGDAAENVLLKATGKVALPSPPHSSSSPSSKGKKKNQKSPKAEQIPIDYKADTHDPLETVI